MVSRECEVLKLRNNEGESQSRIVQDFLSNFNQSYKRMDCATSIDSPIITLSGSYFLY